MDTFTRGHLRAWASSFFLDDDEVENGIEAITAFVEEYPDVIELPRGAGWPEVWSLVERRAS